VTMQLTLEGKRVVVGDIYDRISYILEVWPETQENYKALQFRYWMEFDGLREVLRSGDPSRFEHWYRFRAKSAKTLLQRCQEVQNRRPDLEPAEVREKRLKQSRRGPVG